MRKKPRIKKKNIQLIVKMFDAPNLVKKITK